MTQKKLPTRPRKGKRRPPSHNPNGRPKTPSLVLLSPRKALLQYQTLDLQEIDQAIHKITYYPKDATRTVWTVDKKSGKSKMKRVPCGGEEILDIRDLDVNGLARLIELRNKLVAKKMANLPKVDGMGSGTYLGIRMDSILKEAMELAPPKNGKKKS